MKNLAPLAALLLLTQVTCYATGGKAKATRKVVMERTRSKAPKMTGVSKPVFSYSPSIELPKVSQNPPIRLGAPKPSWPAPPTETEDQLRIGRQHQAILDFIAGRTNSLGGYDMLQHRKIK